MLVDDGEWGWQVWCCSYVGKELRQARSACICYEIVLDQALVVQDRPAVCMYCLCHLP